jgi:hypothetical protein
MAETRSVTLPRRVIVITLPPIMMNQSYGLDTFFCFGGLLSLGAG